ncbi:putative Immunoglobulin domain-containing protein 1, partial [Homarus americanus]
QRDDRPLPTTELPPAPATSLSEDPEIRERVRGALRPHPSHPPPPRRDARATELNNSTREVFLGDTATLECTVHDLLNESVSWMRQVDEVKLLTYTHTYVPASARGRRQMAALAAGHRKRSNTGRGGVPLSSGHHAPPHHGRHTQCNRARVVDERGEEVREKHYNSGSMIELKCVIDQVPFPPGPVTWRRGATTLSFNTSRGGISVKGDAASGFIASRLYVANAAPTDSGRYSCWYANYTSDTVTVHVIAGENSAFMQHDALPETPTAAAGGGAAAPLQVLWWWPLLIVVTLATCDFFHTLLTWVDSTTSYCRLHHHPLLHTSTT